LAGTKRGLRELCVKADRINESSWSTNNYGGFVPPCPAGYTAAPISYSLFGVGNRSGDFTLNVTPPLDGYQHYAVVLREGKKPVVPKVDPINSARSRTRDSSSALIGTWRVRGVELGKPLDVTFQLMADGTTAYLFRQNGKVVKRSAGKWPYSKGVLYETFEDDSSGTDYINFIDRNHFVLTIINNGVPNNRGVKT
jgi:hypothetical protein